MIDKEKLTPEIVLVILGTVAGLGVFPFFVLRLLSHEYSIACVDLLICICCLSVAGYTYKTKKTRIPTQFIIIVCIAAELFLISAKGISLAYWLYPVFMGIYHLISGRRAFFINALIIVILVPMLIGDADTFELLTLLLTLMITNVFSYSFADINKRHKNALTKMAMLDGLTGVNNRRAFDQQLAEEVKRGSEFTLIMLDIDHFKKVNDQCGHEVGDDVLIEVANVVRQNIRSTDHLFRFGGEEFVIIAMSNDLNDMHRLSEKIRKVIESHTFLNEQKITISLGFAVCEAGESVKDLFHRCDKALYRAKNSGRNHICYANYLVAKAHN